MSRTPDGPGTVLVAGATGFVGSRLVRALAGRGLDVRAMSRSGAPAPGAAVSVRADAFDPAGLAAALEGVGTAFYLLHSMEGGAGGWRGFAGRERVQAQNFVRAAAAAGVRRIIYLGGLAAAGAGLSGHMRSRADVGRILASGGIPVTELRASIIIGAGGGSYEMLRHLVERLGVMVCPRWVRSRAQPIAVGDVVEYLAGCALRPETSGRTFEIGGPEVTTYERMMREYAAMLGRRIRIIVVPFLTTGLSSYWVDLVTPVSASLARPLIGSLVHDTVVTDGSIRGVIPLEPMTVREAMEEAAAEDAASGRAGGGPWRRAVLAALAGLAACGTTYYWLDARPEALGPAWLALSALWYLAIGAAALFVRMGARLGYLVAGALAWAAAAFWLADNLHLALGAPLIAAEPPAAVAARNFAGAALAAVAIAASHAAFHGARGPAAGRPR